RIPHSAIRSTPRPLPPSPLSPYTTLFRSSLTLVPTGSAVTNTTISVRLTGAAGTWNGNITHESDGATSRNVAVNGTAIAEITSVDRKSTRLNSSHVKISYAVFCLKKKTTT